MRLQHRLMIAVFSLLVAPYAAPSNAQGQSSGPGATSSQPHAAVLRQERGVALEAAFLRFEYGRVGGETVGSIADATAIQWALDWQLAMLEKHGNPSFIASGYALNLWRAQQLNSQFKDSAAIWLLTTLYLIEVKGLECEDQTSPVERRSQFLGALPVEMKAYVDTLSGHSWNQTASLALMLASNPLVTSAPGDDWLCRAGAAAFAWQGGVDPATAGAPPDLALAARVSATRKREDYRPTFREKGWFRAAAAEKTQSIAQRINAETARRK
jgi:hypothetical protein